MKIQLITTAIALSFAMAVYADSNHAEMDHSKMDHSNMPAQAGNMQGMDHSKMDHSKMTPEMMNGMHKSMEQEMIKIINTVDINQRKKLFVAHKAKMQGMQGMMKESCAKTK